MSPPRPQLLIIAIMLKKPQKELEKLCDTLIPVAVAPLTNGVCYEEQLLGQLLQKLTKLFKLNLKNQLTKLFSPPLPAAR